MCNRPFSTNEIVVTVNLLSLSCGRYLLENKPDWANVISEYTLFRKTNISLRKQISGYNMYINQQDAQNSCN